MKLAWRRGTDSHAMADTMQVAPYSATGYYKAQTAQPYAAHSGAGAQNTAAKENGGGDAAIVTISDAARSASAEPDFASIISAARQLLNELLAEAERTSPLEGGKLALDMTRLSQRELHAMKANDDALFTSDERKAAELEMQRRFGNALAGPLAVSELTSDYRPLYRAAAAHLDALSAEQKAEPQWKEARAAIDAALVKLAGNKGTPPADIAGDPVAAWLETRAETGGNETTDPASLEESLRAILDKQYEKAREAGRSPTFDPKNTRGEFVDLAAFDAETISTMVLNRKGLFSTEEIRAANAEIRKRANVALSEGYRDAAKSGDPTAFARNVISIYSSLSPDVRQAAGFSDAMLSTAISSFETTSRLMEMMASNMQGGGAAGWFAGR